MTPVRRTLPVPSSTRSETDSSRDDQDACQLGSETRGESGHAVVQTGTILLCFLILHSRRVGVPRKARTRAIGTTHMLG